MPEVICSKDNKKIKDVVKLINFSKYRTKKGLFVIDGLRICLDAVKSNVDICEFIYTSKSRVKNEDAFKEISILANSQYEVSEDIMKYLSSTVNPQGFICVCKMLDNNINIDKINNRGKFIGLENVQDPSNVGAIIRTAEALGIDGIIASLDCCDIYNPKVIRTSMGAIFRIPILYCNDMILEIEKMKRLNFNVYASVPNCRALSIKDISFNNSSFVLIGNEGNGLSIEVIKSSHHKINIPMFGKADSLSASMAAGIIMWEMVNSK